MMHELDVCEDCLMSAADVLPDHDRAEKVAAGQQQNWMGYLLIADGEELGYMTSACEGCGSPDHGNRYRMFAEYDCPVSYSANEKVHKRYHALRDRANGVTPRANW